MKITLLLYAVILCHGAFEYKTGDPNSLVPFQTAIHDYSSPVVMMNPSLLPFAKGLMFNSNAGRPYSDGVLTTGGSALQYGADNYGFQLAWNSFGADFYREHTFSLKGGYSIFSFLHAGISGNIYILKISADDVSYERKAADTDFSILLTPLPWINAAFIQTSIVSFINKQNDDILYPERSGGILLKPGKGFSLAWNITETAAGWANSFSAAINPASFLTVEGGYCRENSSFSAAISFLADNFFVSYGLKYHPYLGYTNSIGISYAIKPCIESLEYGEPLFISKRKKINIQSAGPDDLKKIEGLSSLSAERIIKYRLKIGAVNEKALKQIGLTAGEIDILEANIFGLERTPRNKNEEKKFKKFIKKPPRRDRIKNKFRQLIGTGIPAVTAIKYSELSESAENSEFLNKLYRDNSLTDEQKKFIEKTCSR